MRAATLREPGRFAIDEIAPPEPGPGEVRLAIRGCGVCASNLGPWHGVAGISFPLPPGAPGHEAWGEVAALGEGVDGLRVGDAVAALSYRSFAEHDVASAADVVALPPALAGRPFLGEPLACAVNIARRCGVAPGDTVVIVGVGFLGALLVPLLRRAGAARIVAVSGRPDGLDLARRMGADEVLRYDEDVHGAVGRATGGRLADVVVEATGHQGPLDLASSLVRVRGRLVIAGYHQDGPRTINLQHWNWNGIDVVNAHERDPGIYRAGMREAVRLVAAGELDASPLLTHSFPLAEINAAFATAASRPPGFLKAIVLA